MKAPPSPQPGLPLKQAPYTPSLPSVIALKGFHKKRTMVSFEIKNNDIANMNIIDFGSR